jgi:hypothetical protein
MTLKANEKLLRDRIAKLQAEVLRLKERLGEALVRENNALAELAEAERTLRAELEPADPGARGWER